MHDHLILFIIHILVLKLSVINFYRIQILDPSIYDEIVFLKIVNKCITLLQLYFTKS